MSKVLKSLFSLLSIESNNQLIVNFCHKNRVLINNKRLFATNCARHSRNTPFQPFKKSYLGVLRTHRSIIGANCTRFSTFDDNRGPKMPPITGPDLSQAIDQLIKDNKVVIFSKTTCPFCTKVKALFDELNVEKVVVELDQTENGQQLHEALKQKLNRTSVPQVFINGQHIGGCDDTVKAKEEGVLAQLLKNHDYDYDLIVIGGGSGGLAASKEAVKYNKKVAVLDYVLPTPLGTTWGLGGTCVNVGCIPKKLMHTAALIGQTLKDAPSFGWNLPETITHDWNKMKDEIQNYVRSINFGYRVALREKKVNYINAYASFVDPHKIKCVDKKGKESFLTAETFIIATGERPRYPTDVPGVKEFTITSDDLFSLPYCPGKTLVIGASYVALECAGFLHGLGLDVTVMVRSIFLRGFDQEMAEKAGDYMKEEGMKFLRPAVPVLIEQLEAGTPGKLRVTSKRTDTNEVITEEYNTVLFAIGRDPCTDTIGLENAGVIKEKNGKLKTINEQTNVPNIYAIGDILSGKLELTPVAIEAGVLLARRLYTKSTVQCDYINVPTTVFTPLEYGACGYSEEQAIEKFGEENLEIYIQSFCPLEWQVPHRPVNACFAKLICLKSENDRLLGFHYLGPNAGEVSQLIGLPLKMKATKKDIDALIGIHPTCAEVFTTMVVTKRSGESAEAKGC